MRVGQGRRHALGCRRQRVGPQPQSYSRLVMRAMVIGVPVLLVLAGVSLAALRQDPKVGREPIKSGDRMSRWIGTRFHVFADRSVAREQTVGEFTLVAVGVDYAEFKSQQEMLVMVPLAVLRFEVGTPPK